MIESVRIQYNIDKSKIQNIMENVLSQYCKMKIYGYNKQEDFYWCKEQNKCLTTLYITIAITAYDYNKSYVTITPTVGKETDIQKFIQKFKDAIQMYQHSSFIHDYLETK